MKSIKFTISEEEVINVAKSLDVDNLSDEKIDLVLGAVEGDEVLWKNINKSISSAIENLIA